MRICVYCSSSSAVDEVYSRAAHELGQLLASRGHSLVYGGANVGIMGELAKAVKAAGGQVMGVIPRRFQEYGLAYEQADEIVVTESMAERKALMERHADAFVALPGGFGTLEELVQVMTLKQLGYVRGPIVLLNIAGFYDHLLAHFERFYRQCFAKPAYRRLYHVTDSPQGAMNYIDGYVDTALPQKWF